eukprot:snap_masked-scaffold9881_size2308-processed-gene-0.1 protein:Tk11839 transcript:snap_masked-scaffold9881_size2308-processed-gene-0.1-mRNA-1 annotation:"microcin-processing peptidase 1"
MSSNDLQGSPAQREQLESLAQLALDAAAAAGATSAETDISTGVGLDVGVRLGEVETLEHQRDRGMDITVYMGYRKASSSTSDFSVEAIKAAAEKACAIAKHGSQDPCAGLADAELMAKDVPDLDLYHPWAMDVDEAIEHALRCEQAGRDQSDLISNSEGATCGTYAGEGVYANSHGLLHFKRGTQHGYSCTLVAGEGDKMQRDYWFSSARMAQDLSSPESVGIEAAKRALSRLEPRAIKTGTYPVLFNPLMARGLIQSFIGAISGGSIFRRASFLLDKVGEQVFPEFIDMAEFPLIPRAMGSGAIDSEGVARQERVWVEKGVLQGYILSSYSARKLSTVTTGNAGGVRNFSIAPGEQDFDQMLKTMGTGLLVTEMMGGGGNTITGDYSRGASGFWVENGEIAFPVEEITVAGNLADMFMGIAAVGNDVYLPTTIRTGSILLNKMTVAAG